MDVLRYTVFKAVILLFAPLGVVNGCDVVLVHGQTMYGNGANHMLGHYYPVPGANKVWKHETSNMYFWMYSGLFWMLQPNQYTSLNGYVAYCYSSPNERQHPAQCPGTNWQVFNDNWATGLTTYRVDCESTSTSLSSYMYRLGNCDDENDIEDLVSASADQPACLDICDQDPTCESVRYNRDGCWPTTSLCQVLTAPPSYLSFVYTRGLISAAAVGRPAHQSSTHPDWSEEGTADKAVDGDLEARFMHAPHCTHTDREVQPWWAVEINPPLLVTHLLIRNRADCCSERLSNIKVMLGNEGRFAENEDRINSRQFTELVCKEITSVGAGERIYFECDLAALATYVLITFSDPELETTLTLCEVEVVGTEAGQYLVQKSPTTGSEADQFCASTFGGYAANILDYAEWDVVLGLVRDELTGHACLNKRKSGTIIGNKVANGDFVDPAIYEGNHLPGWNVALPGQDADCEASSVLSSSYDCTRVLDLDLNTEWRTYDEGQGAWIKITLRYQYSISIIAVMQKEDENYDLLSIDFQGGVYIDDFWMPEDEAKWGVYYLNPVIVSSYVILTGLEVRTTGNCGFKDVRIYAQEPEGYTIRDGGCSGNGYGYGYDGIVGCAATCTADSNCAGFIYQLSADLCMYWSSVCSEEDTVVDSDKTIFTKSDYDGVSMRTGDCAGYDLYQITGNPSAGTCYTKCIQNRDCRNFLFVIGNCWLKYKNCEKTSSSQTYQQYDIVQDRAYDEHYVNCYSGAEVLGPTVVATVNNNQECVDICNSTGYLFASTSTYPAVSSCRCGNSIRAEKAQGYNRKCNAYCPAGDENCGSSTASSVYSTQPVDKTCLHIMDDMGVGMMVADACGEAMCVVCERDYDACVSNPCQNSATCNTYENYYNCTCAGGFEGFLCDTEVDECESNPCENGGTCEDAVDGYICACALGHMGELCETDYDECNDAHCYNDGTCNEADPGAYICDCVTGYTGEDCQSEIDECESNPCNNNGFCSDFIGLYNCTCMIGFMGAHCEINVDDCVSEPCLNGSTCVDDVDSYTCACAPGFTGTHCAIELEECGSNPCTNGGSCIEEINLYYCECLDGFTGYDCETDIDECATDPCENHAACHNLPGSFECECLPGFTGAPAEGKHCQDYVGNPGEWGPWGNWTDCSVSCGDGVEFRTRACIPRFEKLGQGVCVGVGNEDRACHPMICPPVDGRWGPWKNTTVCPSKCGPGIWPVTRECSSPPAQHGGKPCEGISETNSICHNTACPVYEYPGEWSEWTLCNGCGQLTTRNRAVYTREISKLGENFKITAIPHIIETDSQHCKCTAASMCEVCDISMPGGSNTIPMCPAGGTSCSSSQTYCGYTYVKNSGTLSLSKSCMSESECNTALDTQKKQWCRRLTGLVQSYAEGDGQSTTEIDKIVAEDIIRIWRRIDSECIICCKGNMCNMQHLAESETLFEPEEA